MLEYLKLQNLGPAPEMQFEFGPRINVLTGDNGLGKTFALDLIWWILTDSWADNRVLHPSSKQDDTRISYRIRGVQRIFNIQYEKPSLTWPGVLSIHNAQALILYARIDGGVSIWDTASPFSGSSYGASLQFKNDQLWNGLTNRAGALLCRGLIEDCESWRLKNNDAFELLQQALNKLSPVGRDANLILGESVRLPDAGAKEIPTLITSYGSTPITHASAGIRRILSLAYMIVWAWIEHKARIELRGRAPVNKIVLLWDEVEAHLHPQWQRTIMPSVLSVLESLLQQADGPQIQIIATTHAPLVLASLETSFNSDTDRLFNLQLDKTGKVELEQIPWAKQGDVVEWLRSPAFDMASGYSSEAERALQAAQAFLAHRQDKLPDGLKTREQIEAELKRTLGPEDPFWPSWLIRPKASK